MAENLRFLGAGSSALGQPEAKERPKGVSDGQQVKIPALPKYLKSVYDAGEDDKRGRGKTRVERHSEIRVGKNDVIRREKVCVLSRCPYRKPTQVDEERILR